MDSQRRSFLRGRIAESAAAPPSAPPRPPWALRPDGAFTAACTRCGECVRVCPRSVLNAGDGGLPEIRFTQAGCSLCGECATACTPRAIDRAAVPEAFAWRVQVADSCLNRRGVECRVCGDACDARALRFVPTRGGIAQLQLHTEACTGCGDCLAPCPVQALSLA